MCLANVGDGERDVQDKHDVIEDGYDSAELEEDFEKVADMFQNAKFIVAFHLSELDDVVSDAPEINIVFNRNCYCFDRTRWRNTSKVFRIKSKNNCKLTKGYILKCLERQRFSPNCNHIFVESFDKVADIDNIPTYEVFLGS